MNDSNQNLHELIKKQMSQTDFEVVGMIPIPANGDKMVRLRTMQEILEDFDADASGGSVEYLLQVKPRSPKPSPHDKAESEASSSGKSAAENIYLASGKLNIPYLFKNAEMLFEAGNYPLARNIYQAIFKSGGYTALSLFRLARCFEAEEKTEEAQKYFEESITFSPSLEAYQRLAALFIRDSKDQRAAEVLERALHLKDLSQRTRFDLHKSCGNCWTRAKRKDDAEKHFKSALEIEPTADEIRSNLGALYLQSNQVVEAKRHFQDAIASNPKNHQALSGLGTCALAENDKKSAHDYFVQSLQIELNNPTSVFYLVKCAYEIKSYATAAQLVSDYIQIAPVNTNLLYSLAGLQFHLGRIPESKATTLRILELHPEHAGAKDLLNLIGRYSTPSV